MQKSIFVSVLADRFSDFLTFRGLGGMKSRGQIGLLRHFDRFLAREGFQGRWLTRELIENAMRRRPNTFIRAHKEIGSLSYTSSVAIYVSSNRSAFFQSAEHLGNEGLADFRTSTRRMR